MSFANACLSTGKKNVLHLVENLLESSLSIRREREVHLPDL